MHVNILAYREGQMSCILGEVHHSTWPAAAAQSGSRVYGRDANRREPTRHTLQAVMLPYDQGPGTSLLPRINNSCLPHSIGDARVERRVMGAT